MSIAEALGTPTDHTIETLIERHQVAFETYPIWRCPENGSCVALGCELVLIGMENGSSESRPEDGGTSVREALVAIARTILPSHRRAAGNPAFDVAMHFAPRRPVAGHEAIVIDLVHRDPAAAHEDDAATRALLDMKARLQELGAHATWW